MNRRSNFFLLSGLLVLVLTLLLAILFVRDWSGVTIPAFLFILWAETVFFGGCILIERRADGTSQIILRVGTGVVVTAYSLLSILISLLFMGWMKNASIPFAACQAVLLAVSAIAALLILTAARTIHRKDEEVLLACAVTDRLVERLTLLGQDPGNAAHSGTLTELAERLRFSDTSAVVPADTEIDAALTRLEAAMGGGADSRDEAAGLLDRLGALINRRRVEASSLKQGGI